MHCSHTITPLAESGRLEFEEFVTLAAKFIVEEDAEALEKELREAFRLYDKEGTASFVKNSLIGDLQSLLGGDVANNYFNNSDYFFIYLNYFVENSKDNVCCKQVYITL